MGTFVKTVAVRVWCTFGKSFLVNITSGNKNYERAESFRYYAAAINHRAPYVFLNVNRNHKYINDRVTRILFFAPHLSPRVDVTRVLMSIFKQIKIYFENAILNTVLRPRPAQCGSEIGPRPRRRFGRGGAKFIKTIEFVIFFRVRKKYRTKINVYRQWKNRWKKKANKLFDVKPGPRAYLWEGCWGDRTPSSRVTIVILI